MGVEIRFTKWGGRRHWEFVLEPLGDDEHGWWLGGRAGMTMRRGLEPPLIQPHDFVTLVPAGQWWVASFNGAGDTDTDVYVDVTTAPVRSGHAVEAVDLDLDVVRLRDGSVLVLDEDEFAEHQVRYRYPPEVIARAQASCDDLVRRITAGEEPFVQVAAAWLRRLGRRSGGVPGAAVPSRGCDSEGMATAAQDAVQASGVKYRIVRHGPARSLAEAARNQGVEPRDIAKTIVVRRGEGEFVFVLVPGDRVISWPKLRALLGVNRLSMPDAATAKDATGYERGTITPFGSSTAWPVIADERLRGRTISLGAGEHGVGIQLTAEDAVAALDATVADVTDPEPDRPAD